MANKVDGALNENDLKRNEAGAAAPGMAVSHSSWCIGYTRHRLILDKRTRRMNEISKQTEFLSWNIAPARLNATQTAWFLGFEPHEISILLATGLLKPLGHPPRNGSKFFAAEILEQLRRDEKWLSRASDAICNYWRERNARKGTCGRGTKGNTRFNQPSGRGSASASQPEAMAIR
jgi:hypothetical protein